MGFLENLKRRLGMAKRFRGGIKEEVEEIAERVAEEEIEEMVEEELLPEGKKGKKSKEDFLRSKGLDARPNSHMAIKAWEEYQDSFYDW